MNSQKIIVDSSARCSRCGSSLAGKSIGDLCAPCLLKLALNPTDVSALPTQTPAAEADGDIIGRYRLIAKLGEGGCGVVYAAEQTEPVRRRVALKVIKLGMDTRAVIARFEAERQALAMMDHPNIAKALDAGSTASGRPFFVMELVEGLPITTYCQRATLHVRQRIDLVVQVCRAIQHAHQKGIVHRDIKPSNVLVTVQDGRAIPKLIDFGIAHATEGQLTDGTVYTQLHQLIGTPAYMSPEQAAMRGLDVDARSDIYSLGALLYELLAGASPFESRDLLASGVDQMRKTIIEAEPLRPSARLAQNASAPPDTIALLRGDLDWIVMKCLEKDRARRYSTATALADDLERCLQNQPVTARPPAFAYKLQKAWRRNMVAVSAGAAIAIALLAGAALATWAFLNERQAQLRAATAETGENRERAAAVTARDEAAILLSHSQAAQGVRLLEANDPTGLLHLLESRRTVEHLPEERAHRTTLWNGWANKFTSDAPPSTAPIAAGRAGSSLWRAMPFGENEIALYHPLSGAKLTAFKAGNARVSPIEMSADGKLLITKTGAYFQLWNLTPALSNLPPERLVARAQSIVFDIDRRYAVSIGNDGTSLRLPREPEPFPPIANAEDKEVVQIFDAFANPPRISKWDGSKLMNHKFAISRDGKHLAAGWRSLALLDPTTGAILGDPIRVEGGPLPLGLIESLVFSPDNKLLWEFSGNGLQRYDVSTRSAVGEAIKHSPLRGDVLWNETRQFFATPTTNGFAVIQLNSGQPVGPAVQMDSGRAVALSADGALLAIAGADLRVRTFNARNGQAFGSPIVLQSPLTSASFSRDGNSVAITLADGTARVAPLRDREPKALHEWQGLPLFGFNDAGRLLAHDPATRTMRWLNPQTGSPTGVQWRLHSNGAVISAAFDPAGPLVAVATEKGQRESEIEFWDGLTGTASGRSISWSNRGPLHFSHDGQSLAGLNGETGSVQLWNVSTRAPDVLLALPSPMEVGWLDFEFRPDGQFLATRSGFGSLHIFDRATRSLVSDAIYIAISRDWQIAQSATGMMDISNPKAPRPLANSPKGVVAISNDKRLAADSLPGNKFRLWDLKAGKQVGPEAASSSPILEAYFSPDSRLLLTIPLRNPVAGSKQSGMQLWDTSTGLPCGAPLPNALMRPHVWFDPASKFVVVQSRWAPFETKVWQLPSGESSFEDMERATQDITRGTSDPNRQPQTLK